MNVCLLLVKRTAHRLSKVSLVIYGFAIFQTRTNVFRLKNQKLRDNDIRSHSKLFIVYYKISLGKYIFPYFVRNRSVICHII